VIGGVLVLAGTLVLVLPGPGLLVIFIGLALLAPEFPWARRALDRLKTFGRRGTRMVRCAAGQREASDEDQATSSR